MSWTTSLSRQEAKTRPYTYTFNLQRYGSCNRMIAYGLRDISRQAYHYGCDPSFHGRPQGGRHAYLFVDESNNIVRVHVPPQRSISLEFFAQTLDRRTGLEFVLVECIFHTAPLGPVQLAGSQDDVIRMHVDPAHLFVRLEVYRNVMLAYVHGYSARTGCHSRERLAR